MSTVWRKKWCNATSITRKNQINPQKENEMADPLAQLTEDELAAWYLRLADAAEKGLKNKGIKDPLSGKFLRTWVTNRQLDKVYEFEAPEHLRSLPAITEVQRYHREVFLTAKKARFTGGKEKWVGVLPRIQGLPGFPTWDMEDPIYLEYESLCDLAPNTFSVIQIQRYGDPRERDILTSLRGFQLKSKVCLRAKVVNGSKNAALYFLAWAASGTDRYDWNYGEHFTPPNPDYGSNEPYAVSPEEKEFTVQHKHAKRLESAGKAAPFKVVIKPWVVANSPITGPAQIHDFPNWRNRKL
jgi:hypothetical protein